MEPTDNDPCLDPWMRAEWWTPIRCRVAIIAAWQSLNLLWSLLGAT